MSRAINDGQSAISLPRCVAAFVLLLAVTAAAQDAKQRLLERVFGDAVRLDPAMVAKVKAAKPGQRFFVDRNGDGRNDECWFIDSVATTDRPARSSSAPSTRTATSPLERPDLDRTSTSPTERRPARPTSS